MQFITEPNGIIDMTDTMYPSMLHKITGPTTFTIPEYSTAYGIVVDGGANIGKKTLEQHEYFCLTGSKASIQIDGTVAIFVRYGFKGQNTIGGPVEASGRLAYIDNCSDTMLVYPPRFGDPSISLLSFPKGITQRFHTHPSIRLGIIIRGQGFSDSATGRQPLLPGVAFCVPEREIHRFVTEDSGLDAISYHPDGEWGPTDENHTLLNRTYEGRFMTGK